MVKTLLCLLLLSLAPSTRADDIPDPMAWWNQLPESSWQAQPTLIRHLTFRGQASKMKRWDKTMQDFSSLGFFQYLPSEDAHFVKRLNPKGDFADLPQELLLDPDLLQLVLHDHGASITAQGSSGSAFKTVGKWAITSEDKRNAAGMLSWLSRNLGYDAVVLDARDGLILAGLLKSTSELGQGLLVKQSAKRWVIKEANARGEALLQMMKTSGSLAVFEVLLAKGEKLEVEKGSKILLGQNNNWLKMMQQGSETPKKRPTAPRP